MQTICSYDVKIADACCQLGPTSNIAILWLWVHKPSRQILQLQFSAWKPTSVSRGQKTVHDYTHQSWYGVIIVSMTSTPCVNAVQVLTTHSQLNCGQNNYRDLMCHSSTGGLRKPFAKPLAVLKTDVAGEYGEVIIFHNRPAQSSPAELSNQQAPKPLSHTHGNDGPRIKSGLDVNQRVSSGSYNSCHLKYLWHSSIWAAQ